MHTAFAGFAISLPAHAAPQDKVFTIGNYPVEATDTNAVVAKEKALADGQRAAFRALLKRLVPVTAYRQLSRLDKVNAADLLSGVSVRSERNSSTDYIANLDFSFDAQGVRGVLSRENIPFLEQQAEPLTVVTVMRDGAPITARNDTGAWRDAWTDLDRDHTLTPVKLATLKPVIHNDTVNALMSGDDSALRILNTEYNLERIVFAVAEPDPAQKKYVVTLAGRDSVGTFALKRAYQMADGDTAYAAQFAAVVSLGILEGRWKLAKAAPGSAGQGSEGAPVWATSTSSVAESSVAGTDRVAFTAEFNGSDQWNEIRTQLLDTQGVEDVEISSISETSATVGLRYPGGTAALANAIGGRGLRLVNADGSWTLKTRF